MRETNRSGCQSFLKLLEPLSSSPVKAKKALACRGLCVRRGSDPLFIRRCTAKVDTPPRHEDRGMHPDPPPSFLFPYRGEAAEAPLWKATKTPGITSLCFSSPVFTFSPFALFLSSLPLVFVHRPVCSARIHNAV